MKKHLLLLTTLIVISFFTSCTTEEIYQNTNLLGVWETSALSTNSTETHTLVFGDKNTGLSIHKSISSSNEITSSVTSFNWNINDNVVTVVEDDTPEKIFVLNSEGQLVLSGSQDLLLEKVSNDYSKYY